MSCPFLSLLPPSSPSLPIHMPSAWSCDRVECVIWVVGCTSRTPYITCDLHTSDAHAHFFSPPLAAPLFMCRHCSAAVMPCGCDCTHWRCWWFPLPFHLLFLFPSLFHVSIAASLSGVLVVCVEMEKVMRVSHSHTTNLLPTTAGWWLLVCAGG